MTPWMPSIEIRFLSRLGGCWIVIWRLQHSWHSSQKKWTLMTMWCKWLRNWRIKLTTNSLSN
jgi:hypothetical protein